MKKYLLIILALGCGFYEIKAQTLNDYIQTAAENNPGLLSKYKEFEAALERIPQASSLQDPTLSVGYFIPSMELLMGKQIAEVSLSQMFPWFGTLKARGDQAALLADAKYEEFLDARNKLYFELAQVYYPLYELNRQRQIEIRTIDILESYKTITTQQFQNGRGPMADVLRVDLQLKSSETNLEILNKKQTSLVSWFNSILNRDYDAPVVVPDSIVIETLPVGYRIDSLAGNPRLNAIKLREQASEAAQRVAIKEGLPKLGAGLEYMVIGKSENSMMENNGQDMLMPMVSVSLPIFRKKYNAAQNEAELMQESYMLQRQEVANSLTGGYYRINFRIKQQEDLIALYAAQIEEAYQVLDLLYSSYSNSGQGFEDVLDTQQQILQYEKMKASAESEYLIAVAEMNYITAKQY